MERQRSRLFSTAADWDRVGVQQANERPVCRAISRGSLHGLPLRAGVERCAPARCHLPLLARGCSLRLPGARGACSTGLVLLTDMRRSFPWWSSRNHWHRRAHAHAEVSRLRRCTVRPSSRVGGGSPLPAPRGGGLGSATVRLCDSPGRGAAWDLAAAGSRLVSSVRRCALRRSRASPSCSSHHSTQGYYHTDTPAPPLTELQIVWK